MKKFIAAAVIIVLSGVASLAGLHRPPIIHSPPNKPFVLPVGDVMHYISPTGSDSNNGTSPATPWLTPNHALHCGDVIIAAAGAYSSANFDSYTNGSSLWGTVSSCPSTSGGIDGAGGIYVAAIVCATAFQCTINTSTQFGVFIDKSNWAFEGFTSTNTNNGFGTCFHASPNSGASASIGYVAFINDIATNCPLAGFESTGIGSYSTDEAAFVGDIAYNGAQGVDECGSGLSVAGPKNLDSLPGTHVFVSQVFSYGNINGPCSPNSIFEGAFTTASAAGAGASSITVAAVTGWGVGWPIADYISGAGPYTSSAIVTSGSMPTLVSSVSGNTIGLSSNVAAPGVTNGDGIVVGTTTDGEGIIFDTWGLWPYTGQAAVENNITWGNGSSWFELFCNVNCAAGLNVYVFNNTSYGNLHDYKHDGAGWDLNLSNLGTTSFTFSVTNNLMQEDVIKPLHSTTYSGWNGTSGVGEAGTGQPVVAAVFGVSWLTISGNFFDSAASATCPGGATCDGGDNIADYNGVNYASGNTLGTAPGFASPGSLPTSAPSCSGYATTYACMHAAGVDTDVVPSAPGTSGKGYQPPGSCRADAFYPTWLKGIAYLSWNGTTLTENAGLVTKPCGM